MPTVQPDETSRIESVFIQDSTSTTGAGKAGLVYNTASLTCYYKRSNGTASVAVSLANITTLGTYVSGGFKEVDATHMAGYYEFHPPNAALASGADWVDFFFQGATGMAPVVTRLEIVASASGTTDANVISVNGTTFAGENVPAILADGVAHGGTLGSSTATMALKAMNLTNSSGDALSLNSSSSGGVAMALASSSGIGLQVASANQAILLTRSSDGGPSGVVDIVDNSSGWAPSIHLYSSTQGIYIEADAPIALAAGQGITGVGHGIDIVAVGTGKHGITSTGGTNGDGFHGVGAGTGVGFRSTPDALGFGSGGGGLDAAGVRAAIGMASANLDTQLAAIKSDTGSILTTVTTIAGYVDTEISTILATVTTIAGGVLTIINQTNSPLTAAQLRAALGMASADLDAQLDFILASLGDVAGLDAAGIRAAIGLSTNNLDTQLGDLPTAAENADKLLGRNLEGGSDSGRLVREALYFLRNKWSITGGTLTVCNTSDTASWTAVVTASGASPVTGVDP